ncbi:MAG: NAD-dependent DNA ligase LigA [Paraclostridium sp.]
MKSKMKDLIEKILYYNDLYYNHSTSEISDKEYDELFKKLVEMENKYPELKVHNSPTIQVGADTSSTFEKIEHAYPMLSLDNTYNKTDVENFVRRIKKTHPKAMFILEPKFDGISISLEYVDNIFTKAVTRGNGKVGEDVTENVKQIKDIPKVLTCNPSITATIRGEIIMPLDNFVKLNKQRLADDLPLYKNPRNIVSGTIRTIDTKIVAERGLESRMYYIYGEDFDTQQSVIEFLKATGFNTGKYFMCSTAEEIIHNIEKFDSDRKFYNVDTDGMVIKVNQLPIWKEIGSTGRSPRYAIAYKYDTEKVHTKLLNVSWQVGRTGKLTPVAELMPVFLAGTNVSRATLHNMNNILTKDLRIGDTVIIEKAAEIIPHVIDSVKYDRTGKEVEVKEPTKCPCCGSEIVKFEGKIDSFCSNWNCRARLSFRIEHFVSRDAVNIMNMGPALIESLIEKELVFDFSDIYKLPELFKKSESVVEQKVGVNIENSKMQSPIGLLYGIGIPGIGRTNSKLLMEKYGGIKQIPIDLDALTDLLGKVVGTSLFKWLNESSTEILISKLEKFGVNLVHKSQKKAGPLKGKRVVLTGSMTIFKNKSELINIIESLGGSVDSTVSRKTDILIYGEEAGSKLEKSRKLGITCLSEREFHATMNIQKMEE